MCGICGVVNFKRGIGLDRIRLMRMRDSLQHRGPDDEGTYFYEEHGANLSFGFGHTRLSIIDLTSMGHQPMLNKGGSLCVTYNGEIYNFRDLKRELHDIYGHKFVSNSDTEVLLHAYEQWGIDFLQRLNGIFAFALWDDDKKRFIFGVDRIGVKPLYYTKQEKSLIFSSQLSQITDYLHEKPEIYPESIALYFEYLAIPAPFTIYKGIFKLPSSHYMTVDINGNMDIGEYWHLKDFVTNSKKIKSEREAVGIIKEEIKKAVSMELVSDVPVGLFLSGGIDSSLIAAIVRKELKKDMMTFSVGFNGFHGSYDETAKTRSVAKYFGTEHYSENMDANALEILPNILKHFGEPFGNPTAIAMYRISQFAKKHVKVCLAGVGGDELFAGYPRYMGLMFHSKYKFIGKMLNHVLIKKIITSKKTIPSPYSFMNRLWRYAVSANDDNFSTYEKIRNILLYRPGILRKQSGRKRIENIMRTSGISDILDNMLFADIKSYLPDDLLTYCDRMSMANSLEVRVPLCNFKLVEASFKIDSACKMKNWNMKFVLKEILRQYLPDGIANKKKQGFSVPVGHWLTNELRGYGRKWIEDTDPDIFDVQSVIKLWDEHQNLQYDHGSLLWAIVVFNLWRRGVA